MNARALIVLVRKDLQLFFQDRRAVTIAFAVPLVLASFFAVVFGGSPAVSDGGGVGVSILVVDLDGGALSRRVVEALDRDESLLVNRAGTIDEARELVRRGRATAAVVIPEGFGAEASRALFGPGPKPELALLRDPTRGVEAAMVRGLLTRHVMEAVAAGSSSAGRIGVPFATRDEAVVAGHQEERVAGTAHAFGGMAVQFLLFSSIESGIALLAERQRGLWKRLRAAPLARWMLLLGRGISSALIALMILAVIFGFGALAFGLRVVGSAAGFGLVALAFSACAASFGLVIASLGRTPQAARGLSAMAVLLMVMLGGAWVPTFAFPPWLQAVTPLLPTRWAVDGFDAALARGLTLAEMLPGVLALLVSTAAFALLAAWRFRWEE